MVRCSGNGRYIAAKKSKPSRKSISAQKTHRGPARIRTHTPPDGYCQCLSCFSGERCERVIHCANNGTKYWDIVYSAQKCQCPAYYRGKCCGTKLCSVGATLVDNRCVCEHPEWQHGNHCERSRCQNGGMENGFGGCDCKFGWTGKFCEELVCHNGGVRTKQTVPSPANFTSDLFDLSDEMPLLHKPSSTSATPRIQKRSISNKSPDQHGLSYVGGQPAQRRSTGQSNQRDGSPGHLGGKTAQRGSVDSVIQGGAMGKGRKPVKGGDVGHVCVCPDLTWGTHCQNYHCQNEGTFRYRDRKCSCTLFYEGKFCTDVDFKPIMGLGILASAILLGIFLICYKKYKRKRVVKSMYVMRAEKLLVDPYDSPYFGRAQVNPHPQQQQLLLDPNAPLKPITAATSRTPSFAQRGRNSMFDPQNISPSPSGTPPGPWWAFLSSWNRQPDNYWDTVEDEPIRSTKEFSKYPGSKSLENSGKTSKILKNSRKSSKKSLKQTRSSASGFTCSSSAELLSDDVSAQNTSLVPLFKSYVRKFHPTNRVEPSMQNDS